ncbi:Metallo-dependent phosphatase-like protein [Dimargaris cristalligena]|uniref:Metallo-dependent phosphatase-like protein n=1 Tax=Dimargaris cristalligena TaxID=215637 RepID=A0A4P9ZT33_9FUNG|nr:Metallo-dependent phosphatase-like protein [Dimargaris cristalligena]|eukprot:RKP36627.1 Metallo-dependent phosphatase-like protein [Dimargaris cristalligena]
MEKAHYPLLPGAVPHSYSAPRHPSQLGTRTRFALAGFLAGALVFGGLWRAGLTDLSVGYLNSATVSDPAGAPLKGSFLHISDIHVDANYVQGATLDSYCHRFPKRKGDPENEDLYVAGRFGAPVSSCDSPIRLVDITFNWINRTVAHGLDFVVYTGDRALGSAQVPVIHVVGNNDVEPHNLLTPGPNPMLRGLYEAWQEYIPADQKDLYLEMGYYTRPIAPGHLRAVALNTQWFHTSNDVIGACRKPKHPGSRQLVWLREILAEATANGEAVVIAGHVAPEFDDYYNSCYKRYTHLMNEFRDTIRGQFFGHNNKDHFYFLSSDAKSRRENIKALPPPDVSVLPAAPEPIAVRGSVQIMKRVPSMIRELMQHFKKVWDDRDKVDYTVVNISPSVIPTFNPTLRVYRYQYPSFVSPFRLPIGTLLDYDQFWLNLTEANDEFRQSGDVLYQPEYELLYSARQQYSMPDLTTQSYLDLAHRMTQNKTLRQQFAEYLCVMAGLQEDSYVSI